MHKHYVCGFLFDYDLQNVLLGVRYDEGAMYVARANGIGRRVPFEVGLRSAMAYAMEDMAKVETKPEHWTCFHTERYLRNEATVHYMAAAYRGGYEGEPLPTAVTGRLHTFWMPYTAQPKCAGAPGLEFLVPMARHTLRNLGERGMPL